MSSEALTKSAVTELLRARLDPALECAGLERGPLGNAQETWFVRAVRADGGERRLVLRRSAASGTLEHTDRALEFELLGALARHGFPVPPVHWLATEPSVRWRPRLVMDRLPGAPPGRLGDADSRAVARQLGAWLARLHALGARALSEAAAAGGAAEGAGRASGARRGGRRVRGDAGGAAGLGGALRAHGRPRPGARRAPGLARGARPRGRPPCARAVGRSRAAQPGGRRRPRDRTAGLGSQPCGRSAGGPRRGAVGGADRWTRSRRRHRRLRGGGRARAARRAAV